MLFSSENSDDFLTLDSIGPHRIRMHPIDRIWNSFLDEYGMALLEYCANVTYVFFKEESTTL